MLLKSLKLSVARRRFSIEIKPRLAYSYYPGIASQFAEQTEVTLLHFVGVIGVETDSGEDIRVGLSYMD
jgi:hypothetical protein